MALENISALSQDEQFEEAAKFAGVPASVLRGMWRVESGNGKNMRSPAGARGHFQAMPATQATFEERLGRKFDVDNFSDSLVLAAHTMKENMALAKGDVGDALRWYNGGNPSRWNNEETRAYVGKVLGEDSPSQQAPVEIAGKRADLVIADMWGTSAEDVTGIPRPTDKQMWETSAMDLQEATRLAEGGGVPKPVLSAIEKGVVDRGVAESAAQAAVEGVDPVQAALETRQILTPNAPAVADAYIQALGTLATGSGGDSTGAFADAAASEQRNVDEKTRIDNLAEMGKFGAALDGNSGLAGLIRWMERNDREAEVVDPNWNYWDTAEETEANASSHDILAMRSARSPRELQDTIARLKQQRLNDEVISANSGTLGVVGWNLLGGLVDPVGAAAGVGVGKLFQVAGAGSRAAFAANNMRKGFALGAAEGAVGNVAFTGMLDAMGEYQSTNDYAASAGFGMVIGGSFSILDYKGTRLEAAQRELKEFGEKLSKAAAEHDAALFKRAELEAGPGASPTEVANIARRMDLEDMVRMQNTMLGDVPDSMRMAADPRNDEPDTVNTGRTDDAYPDDGMVTGDDLVTEPVDPTLANRTDEGLPDEFSDEDFAPDVAPGMKVGEFYYPPMEHLIKTGEYRGADKRIVDAWQESLRVNSMVPMLDTIAALPGLREDFRLLAQKLSRVVDVSGLTPESAKSAGRRSGFRSSQWGGLYFPSEHAVSVASMSPDVVLHEVVHAFTWRELQSVTPQNPQLVRLMNHTRNWLKGVDETTLPMGVQALLRSIRNPDSASHPLSNVGEFVAYGMTDVNTQTLLRMIPSPDAGLFANAWDWMVDAVARVLKLDPKDRSVLSDLINNATALMDDATRELDGVGTAPALRAPPTASSAPAAAGPTITPTPGTAINNTRSMYQQAAKKYGLDKTIPDDAERKLLAEMFARSEAILAKFPIDEARLRPLLAQVGWEATSTRLLLSKNPVLRAFAMMALENPEGAAGRTSTAAVTKQMLYQLYRGEADTQFKSLYAVWRGKDGGSAVEDFHNQKRWERFNKEVYAERDRRWNGHAGAAPSREVSMAADVLDAAYMRMASDQKYAGTLGNQRIELDKPGYQPRLQSAGMVGNMTDAQLTAYLDVVSGEFQATAGFDKAFADKFAREYLSRTRTQAKGAHDVPATLHDPAGADIIRDSLTALGLTKQEILASLERFSRGGPSYTKARIGADLTTMYPDGKGGHLQMMDLMVTDNLYLLNRYSHRVAGEVALARFGIMGDAGLKLVRRAGEVGPDNMRATVAELEAFDQTAAEFLGRPFGTALGKWGDNALAATSALRLGGMGFNQLGEYANGVGALGVLRVGSAIKAVPRLLKEVWAIADGGKADNPLLNSLEVYGGNIGTSGYQLKGMYDINEGFEVFGEEALTVVDKAIRGGSYANRVLSGHRAITAVQIRGMSEQIVMKALRYIREGKEDAALLDMGFTKPVQDGIRADLSTAAVFNSSGEVVSFDLTKIKDNQAAHAFLTAVHRGANQIIQSTYIGESGKWAHDGWLRLLTQFRSYGLTATQKQWRRQSFAYGTGRTVMLLLGAMSVAVPIHMARVYMRAANRDDREKFLERELSPMMMGRATMNYVAAVGLLPDVLEVASAVSGGHLTGGRAGNRTPFVGGQIIPAAGVVNDAWQFAKDRDPHQAAKLLPGSNLPYLQGAINLLDE